MNTSTVELGIGENIDEGNNSFTLDQCEQNVSSNTDVDLTNVVVSLSEDLRRMQMTLASLTNTVRDQHQRMQNQSPPRNQAFVDSGRHYINSWKDLGGYNLSFAPGGLLHPMNFLKKLERLLNEAGVPEGGKLILALGCLRGSAAEWAEIKEDSFRSFVDFVEAFKNRYWGVDEQRSLFYEIKYGKFESGSRADYFLKLARLAKFLSEKINEEDLIAYISQHFSNEPEIRKSIVTQNLDTLEQVEIFLRKLDVLDSSETNNRGRGRNWDRGGERSNERGYMRRNERYGNRVNTGEPRQDRMPGNDSREADCRIIEKVYADCVDDFFSEVESGEEDGKPDLVTPIVHAKVAGVSIGVLIDSGSQVSAVSDKFLKMIKHDIPKLPVSNVAVKLAVGARPEKIKEQVYLPLEVDNVTFDENFLVIPKLNVDVLLGCDFLMNRKVKLDFVKNAVIISVENVKHEICFNVSRERGPTLSVNYLGNMDRHQYSVLEFEKVVQMSENFQKQEKSKLLQLLLNYRDVFSETPGPTDKYEHEIVLREDKPFFCKQYTIPFTYRAEVDKQVKIMLESDVIEQGRTEYVSPLMVVKKKDQSLRVCLDARHLNSVMCKEHVVPPKPEELLSRLGRGSIMSTVDMTSSYWQIPIKRDQRRYTGFVHNGLTYYFKVSPFGLSTAVSSFIRGLKRATTRAILDKLLKDYVPNVQKPNAVLSDNGTQFRSREWSRRLGAEGILVKFTSTYYPQGNQTERLNREIGRLLRVFCHENHKKWSFTLEDVEMCINNVVHESTGFCPNMLQFGRMLENNVCEIINFPKVKNGDQATSLESLWVLASSKLKTKAQRRKAKHDSKVKLCTLNVGDAVLVRSHRLSKADEGKIKKLFALFEGPFYISKVVGPNSYEISYVNGGFHSIQNIVNLKIYNVMPSM
nr:unnamed protein product [Callosobruchus chinensis]